MKAFLPAAILLASCAALPGEDDAAARSLAAAESAFAAQSVREDMRTAFLAHFAPDGVMVRGAAWQSARAWLQPRPAPPIVLYWRPVHVEVARSGDMGLSTGPWRITPRGGTAPTDFGQFVSIWTREPGEPWRVAVDLGISHPAADLWDAPLAAEASSGLAGRDTLEDAEAAFSDVATRQGLGAAWRAWGAPDLRVYREGRAPFIGAEAVAAGRPDDARFTFTVERAATASSGEFGYARGLAAEGASAGGPYLHVWRRERDGWRLALDVLNPARR